ncbi:MAG TPA: ATP-binding protein [Candidatus Thermoplasmatota archaeon]|nr:ATP-binding protein [Candidatus Thermoplasmatota archaeon]
MGRVPGEASVAGLTFPAGRSLPLEAWKRRHTGILLVLAGHAVGLAAFGIYAGASVMHSLLEGALIGALALGAALPYLDRRTRSVIAAMGLMSCSAVLTHLSGGYIEAHFHFFVMLGVIFLYEDWLPYVLAVAYVAVHHGIAGTLDPLSVYNHPGAIAQPWKWATIHALFIFGLSLALIIAWNAIERARVSETRALGEAQDLKRQLHSQEKMAALGSLVSGLAHEVRTPLTVVGASAAILERAAEREPNNPLAARVRQQAEEIRDGVARINSLVLELRRFHALAPEEMRIVPLDSVVSEAARLFNSANKTSRELRLDLARTPPAKLHILGVHQIVLNLLSNAAEATDAAQGIVTVRTRAEGEHAVLVVEDNGSGMSDETLRKAFDPLFTTKKEGMGLGLHIVKRIVEAHGGTIRCDSRIGKGTRFEVRFPLAAATDAPAPRAALPAV